MLCYRKRSQGKDGSYQRKVVFREELRESYSCVKTIGEKLSEKLSEMWKLSEMYMYNLEKVANTCLIFDPMKIRLIVYTGACFCSPESDNRKQAL